MVEYIPVLLYGILSTLLGIWGIEKITGAGAALKRSKDLNSCAVKKENNKES